MRLVHYSDAPLKGTFNFGNGWLRRAIVKEPRGDLKPAGLWVSDDNCEDNWRNWCIESDFRLDRLTHVHDVELAPNNNVLIISSEEAIDKFDHKWRQKKQPLLLRWDAVQRTYDGVIITPYIVSRRLDFLWYNIWDCASGCIWNPSAVANITLREIVPPPKGDF